MSVNNPLRSFHAHNTCPAMKKHKSGIGGATTHLTLLDEGVEDVFKARMAKEIDLKLKADEQRYTETEEDLHGNLYLVPNNVIRWPMQLSTPSRTDVMMYEALKIRRTSGRLDTVVFRLLITKVGTNWKLDMVKRPEDLYGNVYPMDKLRITVKRATNGKTEPVRFMRDSKVVKGSKVDMRAYEKSTSFYDGDELDVRCMHDDGRSVAVSPTGDELTNFFPITIRIISPPDETRPTQERYVAISPQFSRLAKCNRGLRKAFGECMARKAVEKPLARVLRFIGFKNELRGFVYVKPRPLSVYFHPGDVEVNVFGPTQFELLLMLPSVRLPKEDGSYIDTSASFIWTQRNGDWQLQSNRTVRRHSIKITIKRAGSDKWECVNTSSVYQVTQQERNRVYFWQGTPFKDGDQMNVRYVVGDRSYPVSFSGDEDTNIFPVTVHVIG